MIVDRIRGLARVPGSRLRAADENFRVHDARQRKVLKGLLAEVGIIGAVLAWVPDDMARAALRSSHDFAAWLAGYDGPLQLVDGHMRAEELKGQAIPVLVTDLSRAEAAKALATFDAVGDLAGRDAQKLAALLEDVGRGAEEGTEELLAALRMAPEQGSLGGDGPYAGEPDEPRKAEPYTAKITSPIYEIKGERPELPTLVDRTKTTQLLSEIDRANLPEDVAEFLRISAERHSVFHFGRIAEYYAHADAKTQDLMERSVLVLIDLDKAIEGGFVEMSKRMSNIAGRSGWKPDGYQDGAR